MEALIPTTKNVINHRLIWIFIIVSISSFQDGLDFQLNLFSLYNPPFSCAIPGKSNNVTKNQCNCETTFANGTTNSGSKWIYDKSQILSTLVTQLDLVCERRYLQLLMMPFRCLGSLPLPLLGFISDKVGRRPLFLVSAFLDSIIWLAIGLGPINYTFQVVLRVLKTGVKAMPLVGYVLVTELTPDKYLRSVAIYYWAWYTAGMGLAPLLVMAGGYHWQTGWLIGGIGNLPFLAAPWLLLESPVWLRANGHKEKAREVLSLLGRSEDESFDRNYHSENSVVSKKYPMSDFTSHSEDGSKCEESPSKARDDILKDLREFSRCPVLIMRITVLIIASFVTEFVYLGVAIDMEFAIHNIYINAAILGFSEILSSPLADLLSRCLGSVSATVGCIVFGVGLFGISPSFWSSTIRASRGGVISHAVLASCSKLLIIAGGNTHNVFFVTLVPTRLRNGFYSLQFFIGVLGMAMGAFVGRLFETGGHTADTLVSVIYGSLLLGSYGLLGAVIPGGSEDTLPDTVAEAAAIKKDCSCPCGRDKEDKA